MGFICSKNTPNVPQAPRKSSSLERPTDVVSVQLPTSPKPMERKVTLALLGETGIGKTCLMEAFINARNFGHSSSVRPSRTN